VFVTPGILKIVLLKIMVLGPYYELGLIFKGDWIPSLYWVILILAKLNKILRENSEHEFISDWLGLKFLLDLDKLGRRVRFPEAGDIGLDKKGPYEIALSNRTKRIRTLHNRHTLKNIFKAVLFLQHVGPISPKYFQVS
jgi:hypothetical protein